MSRIETRLADETWTLDSWNYYHDPPGDPPTWHSLVNDDDDGTFIYGVGDTGTAVFGFASMTLGSNERCSRARACWRGGSMGISNYNMDVWLIPVWSGDGGSQNWNADEQSVVNHWNGWYEKEMSFVECRDMRMGLRHQMPSVTTPKVTKVWVDFEIQIQPTVAVSGPSGTGVRTDTTVTWTNNFQGDSAKTYQVQVRRVSDNFLIMDFSSAGSATSKALTGLSEGVTYRVDVWNSTDFRSGDYWSNVSSSTFTTVEPARSVMAGTSDMSAGTNLLTAQATSVMPGVGGSTESALVIAEASALMPSGISDLQATTKKSTCQTCRAACNCFISEDGFFSDTLDFDGRNFSTVEGNGSLETPYVIHFMDQQLFRPKTGEIVFDNSSLASGTSFIDVRLIAGLGSIDIGAMTYESPMRFVIRDYLTNESMFTQVNYFLVGATVTFAEAADSQSNFRRIVLSTFIQDVTLGVNEITVAGHDTPGGGGDPLTLSCQAFIPGLFTRLGSMSTIITPFNLYLTQNSGAPIAVSNIKVWVTQI